ncbi:MAG: hypothetical protein ACK4M0_05385 [Phreatobacter sp.]
MTDPASRPLTDALRAARIEEAERTGVVVALREAAEARLAILRDRLAPTFAEVPQGIDLFDIGLTPGETPRLWIDMIAFVEMGRDRRTYRFLQDTRDGRIVLAESADPAEVADRITRYMARRLIERQRLLALPPVRAEAVAHPAERPPADPAERPAAPTLHECDRDDRAAPVTTSTVRLVSQATASRTDLIGGAPPATAVAAPAPSPAPAPPPAPPVAVGRPRGVAGGLALFLIGVGAGAGGLLAVAQLLSRY